MAMGASTADVLYIFCIALAHTCGVVACICTSRRGLAALLILVGGQCESLGTGMGKGTDSHVFLFIAESGEVYRLNLHFIMKRLIVPVLLVFNSMR